MHQLSELPVWESLFKQIAWKQIGEIKGKKILDFGSGEGINSDYYAKDNEVIAVEPSEEMLASAWTDHEYKQIVGDITVLAEYPDEYFDVIICHNVLEYIDDKEPVVKELGRLLKKGGYMSVVKHNRPGRVMQMTVLLNDFDKANELLDGKNSSAAKFGAIRYYEDQEIAEWSPELKLSEVYGIRTFWDLQQNQEPQKEASWQENMIEIEMRVSQIPEYRAISFFHHLLFKKDQ